MDVISAYQTLFQLIAESDSDNRLLLHSALNILRQNKNCSMCERHRSVVECLKDTVRNKDVEITGLRLEVDSLKHKLNELKPKKRRPGVYDFSGPSPSSIEYKVLNDDDGPNDFAHALHNGAFSTTMFD